MNISPILSGKWLIKLNNNQTDEHIFSQLNVLLRSLSPQELHFIYTYREPDLPPEILKEIPNLAPPEKKDIKAQIQKLIDQKLDSTFEYHLETREGNPVTEFLRYALYFETDLSISVKSEAHGPNDMQDLRLALKNPSSLLLLTATDTFPNEHLTLCSDFSDHGFNAKDLLFPLRRAVDFNSTQAVNISRDTAELIAQWGYNEENSARIMGDKTDIDKLLREFSEFKLSELQSEGEKHNIDVKTVSLQHNGTSVAAETVNYLNGLGNGTVLINPKWDDQTHLGAMDQTAQQLVLESGDNAVLIAREKGRNSNSNIVSALLSA